MIVCQQMTAVATQIAHVAEIFAGGGWVHAREDRLEHPSYLIAAGLVEKLEAPGLRWG